jgi:hypothetical protein
MSPKQTLDMLTAMMLLTTAAAAVAATFQLHYETKMVRIERDRQKRYDFIRLTISVIRSELRKAGYYELKNKDDCPPHCQEVVKGIRVVCLIFIAADENFSVSAFQTRCFEGNDIFDDEIDSNETLRGRFNYGRL